MSLLPDTIISAQYATVLPVELFYDRAVERLETLHEALDALPKNPYADNTPTLGALKADMGVADNTNDWSMFLSGAAESLAIGFLGQAAGLSSALTTAAEVGTAMASENQRSKTSFKRAATAANTNKSTFDAPKKSVAFKRAAKPALQTSFTRQAVLKAAKEKQFKAFKQTLKQRQRIERELQQLKEKFAELRIHKAAGVTHVAMTKDGMALNALTSNNPKLVHKLDKELRQDQDAAMAMGYTLNPSRPAAPALRFG